MATEANRSPTATLTTQQAAVAIIDLINAQPTSPRQDEIEAVVARAAAPTFPAIATLSGPQALLLEAIHGCVAAEKALNAAGLPGDQYDAADARFTDALRRVRELSERLPSPRSSTDIVLLAQAAWCAADKANGRIEAADHTEAAQVRVVEAVLELAGVDHL
jgi:hypothetical protein